MTAILLTPLTGQFFDNNGNPLSGGLVYSYVAGTSFGTPLATYTNALGTIPAANPVVLNSAGRADIWGAGTYDFKITDSVGNVIDTISSVTAIFGAGDMTKAIYDPANIAQQLVGTTAVQTVQNKIFDSTNTFTGIRLFSYISGLLSSAQTFTSSTVSSQTVTAGQATDSSNSFMMTGGPFTWNITNGNVANGYQGGSTLPNSSDIHFFVIANPTDTAWTASFSANSLTPTLPTGYTGGKYRRIFSLKTSGAGVLQAGTSIETEGGSLTYYLATQVNDYSTSVGTTAILISVSVPGGVRMQHLGRYNITGAANSIIMTSGDETDVAPQAAGTTGGVAYDLATNAQFAAETSTTPLITNTSSQIRTRASAAASALGVTTRGWKDFRRT